jgi:hypothetical protein
MIGDEGRLHLPTSCGAAEYFPYGDRAGVSIDPNWHNRFLKMVDFAY